MQDPQTNLAGDQWHDSLDFPHGTYAVLADLAGRVETTGDCLPVVVSAVATPRSLPGAGLLCAADGGRRPYGLPPTVARQPAARMGNLAEVVTAPRPVSIARWAMSPPRAGSMDRRRQREAARWLASREGVMRR